MRMDPERWRRIRSVVQNAVEIDPVERRRFLDSAGPDADDRREVESLLPQHDSNPDFLERGAGGVAADVLAHRPQLTPGQVIGSYRVERELGRGGMGIVYLARDEKLGRPVAIKVLPDDVGQDEARRARLRRGLRSLRRPSRRTSRSRCATSSPMAA